MNGRLPAHNRTIWRGLGVSLGLGLLFATLQWHSDPDQLKNALPPSWLAVHLALWMLSALLIVPATLRADEAVRRGRRPLWGYLGAMSSAIGSAWALTALLACLILGYGRSWSDPVPLSGRILFALYVGTVAQICFAGGLALLCRVNQHLGQRILMEIEDLRLRRSALERRLTDSRLAIAEAQMDPEALLRELAQVRRELINGSDGAESRLDDLILRLRQTTSRTAAAAALEGAHG